MTPEFLTEVEEAFNQASHLPPHTREEFLSQTYSGRPDIVREVLSLLRHQADADRFDRSIIVAAAAEMLQDADNVIGSIVGGRYVIRRCIGSGAMAEVYLADHVALNTTFALKRPLPALRGNPEYQSRFLEEARRAVLLKHDNVARVHDVIHEGPDIFVVMEHVDGETLRSRMNKMRGPFTVGEFLPIAIQCASALAAAHEKRIVHLDFKPENIMLTQAGQVKICDFGVARRLSVDGSTDTTASFEPQSSLAGTPAYMAPEVILSEHFDERADLFSLGTVFYEMLLGRNPFLAETLLGTTARVVSETPIGLSGFAAKDRNIAALLERLLAKNAEERFATANAVIHHLQAIQSSQGAFGHLTGLAREIGQSRPLKIAAIIITLSLLAAGLGSLYRLRFSSARILNTANSRPLALIGDFRNQTGDPFFDLTVKDLLTISLQQSHFVDIFPRDRVNVTLQRMRKAPDTKLDLEVSREICARSGPSIIILADIDSLGAGYQIVVRIMDSQTADVKRVLTARLQTKEELNPAIDRLAAAMRMALGEGPAEIQANQKPLSEVTTPSHEALERFSKAMELVIQSKGPDAAVLLKSAVDIDPDFAMALGHLSIIEFNDRVLSLKRAAKAYALRDHVTERENNFIAATYHLLAQQHQEAVNSYRALMLLPPPDTSAIKYLAQTYALMGKYDEAARTYEELIRVDPVTLDHKVMLAGYQAYAGRFDSALQQLDEVRHEEPQNAHAYWAEAAIWLGKGEISKTRAALVQLGQSRDFEQMASLLMAQLSIYEGRFQEAIQQLELDLVRFQKADDVIDFARHFWLSELYGFTGRDTEAEKHIRKLVARPVAPPFIPHFRAAGLWAVRHGRSQILEDVLNRLAEIEREYPGEFVHAALLQLHGEQAATLGHLDIARDRLVQAHLTWADPLTIQSLAEVLVRVGERERALALYEDLLHRKGETLRWHPASLWVMAQFRAAQFAAATQRSAQARDFYQKFIHCWENSPETGKFVSQARLEMQRLPAN